MELSRKTIEKDIEYLRQVSSDVDFQKDDYVSYIDQLKRYCEATCCYALAPVQIGIPKRIIYIKNSSQNMENNGTDGYNEEIVYINPTILSAKGRTTFLEGCVSCSYPVDDKVIYYAGIVDRPYKIDIEYYDLDGTKRTKTIEGFEATVFCHEYDHLNGVLHMDKSKETFKMTLDEMKAYRTEHPYEVHSEDEVFEDISKRKNDNE